VSDTVVVYLKLQSQYLLGEMWKIMVSPVDRGMKYVCLIFAVDFGTVINYVKRRTRDREVQYYCLWF
jgi:hypothetical protein